MGEEFQIKVLFTNNTLDFRSGTELYVRDVAGALVRRGVSVAGFSPRLGAVAEEMREEGIAVVDRLDDLPFTPDIIHGHHHMEVMKALLRFPSTPAILYCHGSVPWEETPVAFPRILHYLAVDENNERRLRETEGIDAGRVTLLPNFVDLDRFQPRPPLSQRPRKALLFSSTVNSGKVATVRTACERAGLELDLLGKISGRFTPHPERELGRYDLVFAKGRAALEALAVGTAVIVMDLGKLGPMVSGDNLDRLRGLNFGLYTLEHDLTAENLVREIECYDAADARAVHERVRREAGLELIVGQLMRIYQSVIDEFARMPPQHQAEMQAAARYLEWLIPLLRKHAEDLDAEVRELNSSLTMRLRRRMLSNPVTARMARSIVLLLRRWS
ncbi:MAG TPA: glycosyltransferase [Acidobacteriota bacterium]|nr:glycosyltransferase [Acidobacteriota bacterium]